MTAPDPDRLAEAERWLARIADGFRPPMELSARFAEEIRAAMAAARERIAELTKSVNDLVEILDPTDGVIHRSSFEHVRREAVIACARTLLEARDE